MRNWLLEYSWYIPFKGRHFSFTSLTIINALASLSELQEPIITFFGGKGAHAEGKYAEWASELAQKCVEHNMSVITGGGPGIMAAANCGAKEAAQKKGAKKSYTLGFGVESVDADFKNQCSEVINFPDFFMRKWFLNNYSAGFVVFPGGIGTADEFFEIINLMKVGALKRKPVILVGKKYWQSLVDWYMHAIEEDFIRRDCKDLFVLTDNLDEAMRLLLHR